MDSQPAPTPGRPPVPGPPAAAAPELEDVSRRLDELDERPLSEHPDVFEGIHRTLHDTLSRAAGEGSQERG
jgi:hypothetical protein